MTSLNLTRATMGTVTLGGLLFYLPLAYVCAAMMILSGITNT